jgi:MoaA/NifB/PqqE/SkfB family radical SAM enzyme
MFELSLAEEEQAATHMDMVAEARPIQVNIETTTLCNARCTFCAYPKVSRPKGVMTMDLFEKICCDFEALGGGLLCLSPMMSDPLVDPLIMARIRVANEKFSTIQLHMFTNLIGLPRLSDNKGAAASLDASRQCQHWRARGGRLRRNVRCQQI